MQNNAGVTPPGTAMPALSDGEASQAAGHGFVVSGGAPHGNLWLDLGMALVAAIVLPLALKWLLETELVARMLRAQRRAAKGGAVNQVAAEDFDFDA